MAVGRSRNNYVQGLRFDLVFPEFPGKNKGESVFIMSFSKASGLSMSLDTSEYREGDDALTNREFPGLVSYDNIVLEHGVAKDRFRDFDFFFEEYQTFDSLQKGSLAENERVIIKNYLNRNFYCVLKVYDRETGEVVKQYAIEEAFVVNVNFGDIDASSGDIIIETMEIAHEGLFVEK